MSKGGAGRTKKPVALTHRYIEALKPESEPYRIPDARCPSLAIRVAVDGTRTFDCAFRIKGGVFRRPSLGRWDDEIGLENARDRVRELKRAARAGIDLLAEEKTRAIEKANRLTLGGLVEKYCQKAVRGKLRTAKEIENRLKRALRTKLEAQAEDIKRRDLRELFDETAEAGHQREAEKRRQTIGAMFRWAVSQDYLEIDPTRGLKAYDAGTPRSRVLSGDEIKTLWHWLETESMPRAHANIMKLQLALGARCSEVAGIMAAEVDTSKWVWTLPPTRSKNGRERVTPIVGIAREILVEVLPTSGPLFASRTGRPLTASHVGQALLKRRNRLPIAHFCTHDLRRSFATGLDSMGIGIEIIAAIVGHESSVSRNAQTLVRHYLRADKLDQKRFVLESWDRRLRAILAGEAPTTPTNRLVDNAATPPECITI